MNCIKKFFLQENIGYFDINLTSDKNADGSGTSQGEDQEPAWDNGPGTRDYPGPGPGTWFGLVWFGLSARGNPS